MEDFIIEGLTGEQIVTALKEALTAYQKPLGGIPQEDLDETVRSILARALASASSAELAEGLARKQDVISDLTDIRSGAAKGATAYQLPPAGIPQADLAEAVRAALAQAIASASAAELAAGLARKQDVITDLADIRSGAKAGASAYQLPSAGIPKTDLALAVRDLLDKAAAAATETQLNAGLNGKQDIITDLADIRRGAEKGDTAYQKPANGIPQTDLAQAVRDLLAKAQASASAAELTAGLAGKQDVISDLTNIRSGAAKGATAYQKPADGIPLSDLSEGVQASLRKADEAAPMSALENTNKQVEELHRAIAGINTLAEGFVRVAGSSSPALSYASYKYTNHDSFAKESAFTLFYPCLVGTKLSGGDEQVGKILFVLKKLGYEDGSGMAEDLAGNKHKIDGSEGDVMVVNIERFYKLAGKFEVEGETYDVFLVSRTPFSWQGYDAEEVERFGWSPDYCVAHQDEGSVWRMHSAYNPEWAGSYQAPTAIAGKFVYQQAEPGGPITDTYMPEETVLGGAGGLHTTGLQLPVAEQYAMNMNPDTEATVPWYNATAIGAQRLMELILAEGGTFDAHNAKLMGSGFSSNDVATADTFEASGSEARNGLRYQNAQGQTAYMGFSTANAFGVTGKYAPQFINDWRNPWKVMEAHRALSYATAMGVGELEWFVFEGNKYKWRSVDGFSGPAQGEATAVVFKVISTQLTADAQDPASPGVALTGRRADFIISTCLYHGMTTQVSPSWWTSGLIFTEDSDGNYQAYLEADQSLMLKSPTADIDAPEQYDFEKAYKMVGPVYSNGQGYARDYLPEAMMLPDTDGNKTGGGLHTYVGKYNWLNGSKPTEGKKAVRGFRRGNNANNTNLSPLTMNANNSPSNANSNIGFGN